MLEKWIVSLVIGFVLRQVEKFKDQTDWTKVRLDLEARVKDLVPGVWFDAEAVAIVDVLLEKIQVILSESDVMRSLLEKLAASDWAGALEELKILLLAALPDGKVKSAVAAL